jgi:hypothetical protein
MGGGNGANSNNFCFGMVLWRGCRCIRVVVWFLCLIIKLFRFTFSIMTKRIIILSFCMLFLVSTTGLPLTIHFCKMKNSVSVNSKCGMCMGGCQHEKSAQGVSLHKAMSQCCHTEIFDKNVKDNFLSIDTDVNNHSLSVVVICPVECSFSSFNSTIQFTDTSPPRLVTNNLYLFNSILLI